MRLEIEFEFENDEPDNTWFSTRSSGDPDIQIHMPLGLYAALGSPQKLQVSITPDEQKEN